MIRLLDLGRGRYGLKSDGYSHSLRTAAQNTFGMMFDWDLKAWVGYESSVDRVKHQLEKRGMEVEELPHYAEVYGPLPLGLRDYQKDGVGFLVNHADEGVLLADDVGLGKTRQAIEAAKIIGGTTVVICPSFVKQVWAREIEKWAPGDTTIILKGVKDPKPFYRYPPASTFIILNYDIAYAWVEALHSTNTVIFDEAHYLQGQKSRRSKACREVAAQAKYRIALTATPMTSRPKDLFNVIDTISPGRFGKFFDFGRRFCDGHQEQVTPEKRVWNFDGSSNLDELRDYMQPFMLRRLKSDVALELPARSRQVVEVEVPKKQIANIFDIHDEKAARRALDLAADGKLPAIVDAALAHAEAGHRVVVFTHRRKFAEEVCAGIRDSETATAEFIHGGLTAEARKLRVDLKPDVLVATIDSAGVGIDLSAYDIAVFGELDWVPSKLVQAEGRLHRFGQKNPVLFQYIIGLGTLDEFVRQTVIDKMRVDSETIGKRDDGLEEELGAIDGEAALAKLLGSIGDGVPNSE